MNTVISIRSMQKISENLRNSGRRLGFVPTMGALHEGHLSLMRRAKRECDILIVSLFVNPTQFGPEEDFRKYPRHIKKDKRLLSLVGCDFLFLPKTLDIYPRDYKTYVEVEEKSSLLEGAIRPGHLRGVCTIVAKLFSIVKPHRAYFGQKDAQQAAVILQMVRDLNFDTKIVVCPIVRDKKKIALSSRHIYLTPREKKEAEVIYESLQVARRTIAEGKTNPQYVRVKMQEVISKSELAKIDYISFNRWDSLEPVKRLKGKLLISLAIRFGKTRLLDNIIVNVK
jgi:pantoate--beta-alanine ligase